MSKNDKKKRKNARPRATKGQGSAPIQPRSLDESKRSWVNLALIAFAVAAILAGVVYFRRGSVKSAPAAAQLQKTPAQSMTPAVSFVGSKACGECHQNELKLWQGSHHDLAMQPATDATVLGDFKDARFSNQDVTTTFFRRNGNFFARTDGPDGRLRDYQIAFTFGVYPLQQYLIPISNGRLQPLGIAWDSRPRPTGGQRWFFLYPGSRVDYRDPLHWTGIDQTWNFMCADCHSTNVRKNYDLQTHTYATSYSEINVACEACHGPGSNHLAWAKKDTGSRQLEATQGLLVANNDRRGAVWTIDPVSGNARRSEPRSSNNEIQTCARCHSRRSQIHENYVHGQSVDDDYRVTLLDADLYFPDGQIKAEDYEYGSFIQSRMFHAGVTCSDCHEPHSLKLRADGNGVCLQCHAAEKYNSPAHHFHKTGSPGALCANCHMPIRTYMVIDARRDHSIRIPRPDLSVKLATPNACNGCHVDQSAQWASQVVDKWYRHAPKGFQRFAETLQESAIGAPGAARALAELIEDREQPAIARATALERAAAYAASLNEATRDNVVGDPSPLVRRAAARSLPAIDPRAAADLTSPLLSDRVRSVRIEAAESLAGRPDDSLSAATSAALARAIDEYIAAQQFNADRPEAHLNLALLFAKELELGKAEAQLKIALSLDPSFVPAAVNLADLYRASGREGEAERALRNAIASYRDDASLEYALGLSMVRQGRRQEALSHLSTAAKLDPSNARCGYVYAVALADAGQPDQAIGELDRVLKLHPYDVDSLFAAADLYEKAGKPEQALSYARRLVEITPDDAHAKSLVERISNRTKD